MPIERRNMALLAELREEMNLAMIFITHDLRVAAEIADRIIVMRRGEIVEQGETQKIFQNPADAYTRAAGCDPGARDVRGTGQHPAGGCADGVI
jgi:ABC-type dipeptide/oligopeptide/nickel transport system ATPase component